MTRQRPIAEQILRKIVARHVPAGNDSGGFAMVKIRAALIDQAREALETLDREDQAREAAAPIRRTEASALADAGDAMAREWRSVRRCEANARIGTGTGMCGAVLNDLGQCPRASDHIGDGR